jgi:hypothetical protein
MDKAATFEASGTVNLDAPEGFSRDVNTTIDAVVNLQRGASHAEDHSDDGDAWSEIVVDDTFYKAQRYPKARADWCAVPLGSEQQAFLQTGSGFGFLPEMLRSAESASLLAASSDAAGPTYDVTFPPQERPSGGQIIDDTVTITLDVGGRPTRLAFVASLPAAGAPSSATASFDWTLANWGETDVQVDAPKGDDVSRPPDCFI